MQALEQIHGDLRDLKKQRRTALGVYVVVVLALVLLAFLPPAGPMALPRDTGWGVALTLLLGGTLLGAVVTIGYPWVRRNTAIALSLLTILGCLAALLMTMDVHAARPAHPVQAGMHCFMFGGAVSAASMALLGMVSGRVWRRFPDPGIALAMGMTGVGLAALHLRCGGQDPLHLLGFHLGPLLVIYALAHLAVRTRLRLIREV